MTDRLPTMLRSFGFGERTALDFPDDPACAYLETQYMLGDSLLVAPVFAADGEVRYYVPAGRWTKRRCVKLRPPLSSKTSCRRRRASGCRA